MDPRLAGSWSQTQWGTAAQEWANAMLQTPADRANGSNLSVWLACVIADLERALCPLAKHTRFKGYVTHTVFKTQACPLRTSRPSPRNYAVDALRVRWKGHTKPFYDPKMGQGHMFQTPFSGHIIPILSHLIEDTGWRAQVAEQTDPDLVPTHMS